MNAAAVASRRVAAAHPQTEGWLDGSHCAALSARPSLLRRVQDRKTGTKGTDARGKRGWTAKRLFHRRSDVSSVGWWLVFFSAGEFVFIVRRTPASYVA